ncbi:MAG TPA: hypothetical protein VFW83_02665, partial [Bryobacteraceae bacterium]|nr:hypothetical protein [Bryobacteraceae bacterium]
SWQGFIYNAWYEALLYGYPSGSGVAEEASAFDAYNGGEGYVEVYGDCGGSNSGWEDSSDNQNDVYVVGVGEYGPE